MQLVHGLLHSATTLSPTNYFWDDYIPQVIWLWRWLYLFVLVQETCNKKKKSQVFSLICMGSCLGHKCYTLLKFPNPSLHFTGTGKLFLVQILLEIVSFFIYFFIYL